MYICQIYRKETKAKISSVKSYAMKLKGNSYRKMIYDLEKHRSIRFTISPKLSKRISGSECLYIALQDFCCISGFGKIVSRNKYYENLQDYLRYLPKKLAR